MAEQASERNSAARLATQVDPKPLAIPSTPLGTRWPVLRECWVAVPEGPDRLAFRLPDPSSPFRRLVSRVLAWRWTLIVAVLCCFLATIYSWVIERALLSGLWSAIVGLLCSVLILWDVVLGEPTATFDRGTGFVTFGSAKRLKRHALAGVVAIQILEEGSWLSYKYYQMNLVWADPEGSRLCLVSSRDASLDSLRHTGKQLADFLSVPLVDQTLAAS
jgi:hypothetical protein